MNYTKDVIQGGPGVTQVRKLAELDDFRREQEALRPLSLWNPMLPPGTVNANDDEFNDRALATAWTEFDPGGRMTVAENKYGLLLTKTGVVGFEIGGIYKPLPAGDFTIAVHHVNLGQDNSDVGGICLWENPLNLASKLYVFTSYRSDINTIRIAAFEFSNYTTLGTNISDTLAYVMSTSYFLRLRRNGVNYYIEFSGDGFGWKSPNNFATANPSFTPTSMGVMVTTNNGAVVSNQIYSFFRYQNSDVGYTAMLEGDRM